jgi:hypothetical protein
MNPPFFLPIISIIDDRFGKGMADYAIDLSK